MVVAVPLVEPKVVVWLEAPVPRLRFWPLVASILAAPELVNKIADVFVPVFNVPDSELSVRS